MLSHSLTHSLIHSPTHSLTHSLTHSFTHSLTQLTQSLTHSFIHLLADLLTYLALLFNKAFSGLIDILEWLVRALARLLPKKISKKLDWQKAFDSVPREWLLIALKLAKVPALVISAIETLIQKWSTNLHLTSHEEEFESNGIHYLRGIFQVDSPSVLLFILSVNPLPFLLKKLKGNQIGLSGKRDTTINHLFFADYLKLIVINLNLLKQQLDLVTQFSSDIGMVFEESKCALLAIDKEKIVESREVIVMNGVAIKPLKHGDSYKYLGQDEITGYVGPLNKARVISEYKKRVRKIWSIKLSAYDKHIAHNFFALPVLTPTFGIICWIIQEIENVDIITRKILNVTGNFCLNLDIDRLYLPRKMGGRGLKSIKLAYEYRIISIRQHLLNSTNRNCHLKCIVEHEQDRIMKVGRKLLDRFEIEDRSTLTPTENSQKYLKLSLEHMKTRYLQKPLHGYVSKYISELQEIDQLKIKQWICNKYMTSYFEAYGRCSGTRNWQKRLDNST